MSIPFWLRVPPNRIIDKSTTRRTAAWFASRLRPAFSVSCVRARVNSCRCGLIFFCLAARHDLQGIIAQWPLQRFRLVSSHGARIHTSRSSLVVAAPTEAERVELLKSMFAWGGTYKTEGNKVIFDVDIAWVQSWVGTRTYQVEMASNKLTVTTPPFKSTLDSQDIVVITTYERAE